MLSCSWAPRSAGAAGACSQSGSVCKAGSMPSPPPCFYRIQNSHRQRNAENRAENSEPGRDMTPQVSGSQGRASSQTGSCTVVHVFVQVKMRWRLTSFREPGGARAVSLLTRLLEPRLPGICDVAVPQPRTPTQGRSGSGAFLGGQSRRAVMRALAPSAGREQEPALSAAVRGRQLGILPGNAPGRRVRDVSGLWHQPPGSPERRASGPPPPTAPVLCPLWSEGAWLFPVGL